MTRVLVSTKELDREEWLEQRRQGIGGSDTPVIILGTNTLHHSKGALGKEGGHQGQRHRHPPP